MKLSIICLSFIFSLLSVAVCGQSKYGNVTIDELNMSVYPNDTTAGAVFLLNEGEALFTYDERSDFFKVEYTIKMKIKILSEKGLDWCNQEIGYYEASRDTKEEIRGLSGTTYNLEGGKITKVKLSKEYIFDEDINNKRKLKKFTMPGAKVGSVIEFKYTVVSDFFYDLRSFRFQSSIPVIKTSYEIIIPEYFIYNINPQGYEAIKSDKTPVNQSLLFRYRDSQGNIRNERMAYSADKILFQGEDIPALKDEPHMWCSEDYISKVSFELQRTQMPYATVKNYSSSWDNIDEKLFDSSSFGGNLKKNNLFKDEVVAAEPSLENAVKTLNLVKNKVKWNDRTSFNPTDLKTALKDGLANSSAMNFLLINALGAAGFEAYPVAISTRESGRIPFAHPSITAFNHVITAVKIDTAFYYTDASDKYGTWNILPERCMVTQARVMINKETAFWANLSDIAQSRVVMSGNIDFKDGEIRCQILSMMNDIAARDYKKSYYSFDNQEAYLENLTTKKGGKISGFEVTGLDADENVRAKYLNKKDMSLDDEVLYINPMIDVVVPESLFKKETRKYPIDLNHQLNYTQIVNIQVPEGYTVEELPKSEKFVFEDDALMLQYRIAVMNNIIRMNYTFRINKMLFLPTDYDMLKDFFGKAVSKNSEQIVLKKISE